MKAAWHAWAGRHGNVQCALQQHDLMVDSLISSSLFYFRHAERPMKRRQVAEKESNSSIYEAEINGMEK